MSDNMTAEWRRFKGQWQNYETAAALTGESSSRRAAIFLACVGTEAYELFQTMQLSEADAQKIEKVIDAFERHFVGETNVTYERYIFNRRFQDSGESFDAYFADLRKLVRTCD